MSTKRTKRSGKDESVVFIPTNSHSKDDCFSQYKKGQSIGEGMYGKIYETCIHKDCKYVMKVIKDIPTYNRETYVLDKIMSQQANVQITPKIMSWFKCKDDDKEVGIIVMERMDGDFTSIPSFKDYNRGEKVFDVDMDVNQASYFAYQLMFKFRLLLKMGIFYGDFHVRNFLYKDLAKHSKSERDSMNKYSFDRFEPFITDFGTGITIFDPTPENIREHSQPNFYDLGMKVIPYIFRNMCVNDSLWDEPNPRD